MAEDGAGEELSDAATPAPRYLVPAKPITVIEHPFIIKNLDRGLESLGGQFKINRLVHPEHSAETQAALKVRPEDRLTRPLRSHNEKTHNLIIKVTVSKRREQSLHTTSKSAEFEARDQSALDDIEPAASLLAKLRENARDYQLEVMGVAQQTHRFRGIPDFVKSSKNSPFMQKMKDTVLTFELEKMKQFKLDMSTGTKQKTEIIPPPTWSHFDVPYNYAYRQNPAVVTVNDQAGRPRTWNAQGRVKTRTQFLPADARGVPTGPAPGLPALKTLDSTVQRLIDLAGKVLEERPIVSRRSLPHLLPENEWQNVSQTISKNIFQYLGYTFSSGPWKDALIKFGLDPRSDPKWRVYQTLTFVLDAPPNRRAQKPSTMQSANEKPEAPPTKESHIFDGKHLGRDGKTWQVCDITDSVLESILTTEDLRRECHLEADGWFHNGTWAKAKSIMRWKIAGLLTGEDALTDNEYARVADLLPDVFNESERLGLAELTAELSPKEKELASTIRNQFRKVDEGEQAAKTGSLPDVVERDAMMPDQSMDEMSPSG